LAVLNGGCGAVLCSEHVDDDWPDEFGCCGLTRNIVDVGGTRTFVGSALRHEVTLSLLLGFVRLDDAGEHLEVLLDQLPSAS
jgi:hypothetical protein